ncbi:MAG: hypothetical protein VYC19_02440 [Pseudomonadota bacterium]|nr:hypothetical protein [Pseudomonadota bacterium]
MSKFIEHLKEVYAMTADGYRDLKTNFKPLLHIYCGQLIIATVIGLIVYFQMNNFVGMSDEQIMNAFVKLIPLYIIAMLYGVKVFHGLLSYFLRGEDRPKFYLIKWSKNELSFIKTVLFYFVACALYSVLATAIIMGGTLLPLSLLAKLSGSSIMGLVLVIAMPISIIISVLVAYIFIFRASFIFPAKIMGHKIRIRDTKPLLKGALKAYLSALLLAFLPIAIISYIATLILPNSLEFAVGVAVGFIVSTVWASILCRQYKRLEVQYA